MASINPQRPSWIRITQLPPPQHHTATSTTPTRFPAHPLDHTPPLFTAHLDHCPPCPPFRLFLNLLLIVGATSALPFGRDRDFELKKTAAHFQGQGDRTPFPARLCPPHETVAAMHDSSAAAAAARDLRRGRRRRRHDPGRACRHVLRHLDGRGPQHRGRRDCEHVGGV